MNKLACALLSSVLVGTMAAPALAQTPTPAPAAAKAQPPKGFEKLGWLAGTRYIDRSGTKSYETWTGISGGLISGAVASASGGGLAEFFVIGPNEQGVYGLKVANTTKGLTNWTFRPIVLLEAEQDQVRGRDRKLQHRIHARWRHPQRRDKDRGRQGIAVRRMVLAAG
jgi:hypothetical protein